MSARAPRDGQAPGVLWGRGHCPVVCGVMVLTLCSQGSRRRGGQGVGTAVCAHRSPSPAAQPCAAGGRTWHHLRQPPAATSRTQGAEGDIFHAQFLSSINALQTLSPDGSAWIPPICGCVIDNSSLVELEFNAEWILAPSERLGFVLMVTERSITYVSVMILHCLELWIFSVYDECEAFKKIRHLLYFTLLFSRTWVSVGCLEIH